MSISSWASNSVMRPRTRGLKLGLISLVRWRLYQLTGSIRREEFITGLILGWFLIFLWGGSDLNPNVQYKPFQPEITATWVTLEAKNVMLNPPQIWGFQARKDSLKRSFRTHWAPCTAPITKSRLLISSLGPGDPSEAYQPQIPATLVTLEAKNVTLNPPQTWGFQAKKDPLNLSFWTHWAPGTAPITKSRRLTCPLGPIDPYEPFQPEITATLVTLEAKNVTLNPPQTWGFQAKKYPLKLSFQIHWAPGMAPITKYRLLICHPRPIYPFKQTQPKISVNWKYFIILLFRPVRQCLAFVMGDLPEVLIGSETITWVSLF